MDGWIELTAMLPSLLHTSLSSAVRGTVFSESHETSRAPSPAASAAGACHHPSRHCRAEQRTVASHHQAFYRQIEPPHHLPPLMSHLSRSSLRLLVTGAAPPPAAVIPCHAALVARAP
jgi:hypothetical protein